MNLQGIVFDFDGVIVDSEPLWQKAEQQLFSAEGLDLTPADMIKTKGLSTYEAVNFWCNRIGKTSKSAAVLTEELNKNVIDLFMSEGQLMEGVQEIIEFFKSKSLPVGIASSSSTHHIKTLLGKFNLIKKFDLIYSIDFERFGKPHPGIYISACKKLKIDPVYSVAIEDSFNGLIAAKSARMKAIALLDKDQINDTKYNFADLKIESLINFGASEFSFIESIL